MPKHIHRFSAVISRGNCFHRRLKGQIKATGTKEILHVLRDLLDHHDDGDALGDLDSISIRVSRVKPRKSKP